MSKMIYITNTSLDGYVEDETGAFDWVDPEQVFAAPSLQGLRWIPIRLATESPSCLRCALSAPE